MIVVAAAIIAGDPPRLLAAQRAYPDALAGRWELPGGKVEPGESETAALQRECREELGVTLDVAHRAAVDVPTIDGRGILRTYWASIRAGVPRPVEHQELRWSASTSSTTSTGLPPTCPSSRQCGNT